VSVFWVPISKPPELKRRHSHAHAVRLSSLPGSRVAHPDHSTGEYISCPTPDCDFVTSDSGSLTRHRKRIHGYEPKARSTTPGETSSRHTPYPRTNRRSPGSADPSSGESTAPDTTPEVTPHASTSASMSGTGIDAGIRGSRAGRREPDSAAPSGSGFGATTTTPNTGLSASASASASDTASSGPSAHDPFFAPIEFGCEYIIAPTAAQPDHHVNPLEVPLPPPLPSLEPTPACPFDLLDLSWTNAEALPLHILLAFLDAPTAEWFLSGSITGSPDIMTLPEYPLVGPGFTAEDIEYWTNNGR
jgi:hypothetical protein